MGHVPWEETVADIVPPQADVTQSASGGLGEEHHG